MSGYNIGTDSQNSKVIHINSIDATKQLQSGYTTNFQYVLDEQFKCPQNQSMLISLHSATIPYSFYNIRAGVNDKVYIENVTDTGNGVLVTTIYTIVLEEGNYTANSLAKEMNSKFIDANLGANGGLNVSYDRTKMKYKYEYSNFNINTSINFRFDYAKDTAHIELGFNANDYTIIKPPTHGGTYSNNVPDVNGNIHGVFVRTNLSLDGSYDSLTRGLSSILARVPITTNFGGVLFWTPQNGHTHKILTNTQNIHTITIRLTDERNRLIDLNGLNFQVSIQFDFIYLKPQIPHLSYRNLIDNSKIINDNKLTNKSK